jgi:hypothetical protein
MQTALVRTRHLVTAALAATLLAGCYTYPPTYRTVAVQRLSPEQKAAIAGNTQLSQADRDRLLQDNSTTTQVVDGAGAYGTPAPVYSYPAPAYYSDPTWYGYPGYPYYYGGFAPFYPSIGLSFGFGGRYGGYRGGGFHGGGFHGGGFHGHR